MTEAVHDRLPSAQSVTGLPVYRALRLTPRRLYSASLPSVSPVRRDHTGSLHNDVHIIGEDGCTQAIANEQVTNWNTNSWVCV